MTTTRKLGIWMDHSDANLMTFNEEVSDLKTISNPFNHEEKEEALRRSENIMHNKRQQYQTAFYRELGEEIISFEEVVLFGPTNAKAELLNILQTDLRFNKVKIDVLSSDKMTENQKKAFVKDYFSRQNHR